MSRDMVTGCLICALTLAAADPLWTVWRIADDGSAAKVRTGLDHQACEELVDGLTQLAKGGRDILWDIVTAVPCKPVRPSFHYGCRRAGEEPE